jgi:hypothetical protein
MAAITKGAAIVEKRFTLCSDGALSSSEISPVIRDIEQAWASLGDDRHWTVN